MKRHSSTPKVDRANDLSHDTQIKGKTQNRPRRYQSQARVISSLMYREPLTRLQAARMAGLIQQANVCRLVDEWLKNGTAAVHHVGKCPVTGCDGVEFITTDKERFPAPAPDLFTPPDQLPTLEGVHHGR